MRKKAMKEEEMKEMRVPKKGRGKKRGKKIPMGRY